jgi:hypothetical protein
MSILITNILHVYIIYFNDIIRFIELLFQILYTILYYIRHHSSPFIEKSIIKFKRNKHN